MGSKMLDNIELMKKSVMQVKSERGKLIKALNEIDGVQAFDSQADFLLVNTRKPADEVNEKLLETGHNAQEMGQNPPVRKLFPRHSWLARNEC